MDPNAVRNGLILIHTTLLKILVNQLLKVMLLLLMENIQLMQRIQLSINVYISKMYYNAKKILIVHQFGKKDNENQYLLTLHTV